MNTDQRFDREFVEREAVRKKINKLLLIPIPPNAYRRIEYVFYDDPCKLSTEMGRE
jgi:hypothetical protein